MHLGLNILNTASCVLPSHTPPAPQALGQWRWHKVLSQCAAAEMMAEAPRLGPQSSAKNHGKCMKSYGNSWISQLHTVAPSPPQQGHCGCSCAHSAVRQRWGACSCWAVPSHHQPSKRAGVLRRPLFGEQPCLVNLEKSTTGEQTWLAI